MSAIGERKLSLDEFHRQFDGEKPYFEYWNGLAVQKSKPTGLHGLIQAILVRLLYALGYEAGTEITLKLDPDYEPVPDVIAAEGGIGDPYPTEPFDIVIEILSPDDPFSHVLRKCHMYKKWGIGQIVVIDPIRRIVWCFNDGSARETDTIATRGAESITAQKLWDEVDARRIPRT